MKLYHASIILDYIDEFSPRVPEDRHFSEESLTPRICLSSRIDGCLTAAPWGGSSFDERVDIGYNSSRLIRIYEFDTDVIGKDNIIGPDYLYQKDLVRDAVINDEYWVVNQSIKPVNSYLIKITHYDNNWCDDDVAYEYVKMQEEGLIDDIEKYLDGVFTLITDVEFEIIPEDRRSKLIFLNNKLVSEKLSVKDEDYVLNFLMEPFTASDMTYLYFEEREDGLYVVGVLDSRYDGELDINDIEEYLNSIIPYGYRLVI